MSDQKIGRDFYKVVSLSILIFFRNNVTLTSISLLISADTLFKSLAKVTFFSSFCSEDICNGKILVELEATQFSENVVCDTIFPESILLRVFDLSK